MPNVDTVARADLAQTKVQLHQMTTALLQTVAALDISLQALERVLPVLAGHGGLSSEQAEAERFTLEQARNQILNSRLYLRSNPDYRRT